MKKIRIIFLVLIGFGFASCFGNAKIFAAEKTDETLKNMGYSEAEIVAMDEDFKDYFVESLEKNYPNLDAFKKVSTTPSFLATFNGTRTLENVKKKTYVVANDKDDTVLYTTYEFLQKTYFRGEDFLEFIPKYGSMPFVGTPVGKVWEQKNKSWQIKDHLVMNVGIGEWGFSGSQLGNEFFPTRLKGATFLAGKEDSEALSGLAITYHHQTSKIVSALPSWFVLFGVGILVVAVICVIQTNFKKEEKMQLQRKRSRFVPYLLILGYLLWGSAFTLPNHFWGNILNQEPWGIFITLYLCPLIGLVGLIFSVGFKKIKLGVGSLILVGAFPLSLAIFQVVQR